MSFCDARNGERPGTNLAIPQATQFPADPFWPQGILKGTEVPLSRAPASELGAAFSATFWSVKKRQPTADAAIRVTRHPRPAALRQTHTLQTTSVNTPAGEGCGEPGGCASPEGKRQAWPTHPARYHIRRDLSSPAAGGSVAKMPIPPGKIGFVKPRFWAAAQQFDQNHHTWPGVRCKMEISARMPKNRLTMRVGWGILA